MDVDYYHRRKHFNLTSISDKPLFQKDSSPTIRTAMQCVQSAMQCVQMIKEESILSEIITLVNSADEVIVKKAIRVFTNIYRYSLQLLTTGDLDEPIFSKAWPVMHSIFNELVELLKIRHNRGIVIHIVHFLEASVVAGILSDLTRYPHIASKMENTINVGIKTLKDFLMLPRVVGGGSTFIAGIGSIITIACYKNNIRKEVVDLIESFISKPPPTLLNHHVRSLHKVLKRHLFRLLRTEESTEKRERLICMMDKVGVPRQMLLEWSTQSSIRKRSLDSPPNSTPGSSSAMPYSVLAPRTPSDLLPGSSSPPPKKMKTS